MCKAAPQGLESVHTKGIQAACSYLRYSFAAQGAALTPLQQTYTSQR